MNSKQPMQDDLIERYRAASAQDESRASPQVRANILTHAAQVAAGQGKDATKSIASYAINTPASGRFDAKTPAANDSRWQWRFVASVAVLGLCGLLFLQFDRADPGDKEIAFGQPTPNAAGAAAPAAAPAPAPAPMTEPKAQPLATNEQPLADEKPAALPPVQSAEKEATQAAKAKATQPKSDQQALAKPSVPKPAVVQPAKELAPVPAAPAPTTAPAPTPSPAQATGAEPLAERSLAAPAPAPAPAPHAQRELSSPAAPSLRLRNFSTAPAAGSADSAANQTDSSAQAAESTAKRAAAPAAISQAPEQSPEAAVARKQPADANVFLLAAARQGNTEELARALERGANPNAKTRQGEPALVLAARSQNLESLRALVQAKADLNATDAQGLRAIDHARQLGWTAGEQLLGAAAR
jgi:hypothetical protein